MNAFPLPAYKLADFLNSSDGNLHLLRHLIKESGQLVTRSLLEEFDLPIEEIESLAEFIQDHESMVGGKRQSTGSRKRRYQRGQRKSNGPTRRRTLPPSLRGYTVPFRRTYLWGDMSGSAGRWYLPMKMSDLIKEYAKTFDEFKIRSIIMRYLPNNNTSATGIYASVLLDQSGFGPSSGGTEKGWFRTISTMPGARVTHRNVNVIHRWRPTEAAANNWFRPQTDSDYTVATCYFVDNGQETVELGGVISITGHLLVRGLYWNAPINVRQRIAVNSVLTRIQRASLETDDVEILSASDLDLNS